MRNAATDSNETSKIDVFCRGQVGSGGSRHVRGNGAAAIAVPMARGPSRPAAPRGARGRSHDRFEVVHDRDPLCVQMGHRRFGGQESRAGAPVVRVLAGGRGPHDHLRAFACRHVVDAAGPRRAVRVGGDERRAKVGDRGFRSFAPAFAALSSRAQDRRTDEGSRARTQRHRNHHSNLDAHRCSDAGRIRVRHSGSVLFVRLAIRRGDSDYRSGVSRVHHDRHQLAHFDPTLDERKRQRRQYQGDRQPAQFRDRQVFRRRSNARPRATTRPWRATSASACVLMYPWRC